jgi:hypothetical protein
MAQRQYENEQKAEMTGCAYLLIGGAIAFAIVISTLKYWHII